MPAVPLSTCASPRPTRFNPRRGELFLNVAVGYVKAPHDRIEKDPDRRVQEAAAAFYADVFFHKSFKTITVSTRRRESWPRNWLGDADERLFLSAYSKKPGRQPGLRRTLKSGAGQFRRTG